MVAELDRILEAIPHDQLALQWDTNFEFGMLEGDVPVWFPDVRSGILERLIRISRLVPPDVELGFHFCAGHDETRQRPVPADLSRMVEIANALAAGLDRPLNWIHMPVPREQRDETFFAPLASLRLQPDDRAVPRPRSIRASARRTPERGSPRPTQLARRVRRRDAVRLGPAAAADGPAAGRRPRRAQPAGRRPVREPGYVFAWPEGFARVPDEQWVEQPVDAFGLQYDTVENHGWYRNLDPTVEQLAGDLRDGEVLVDYSGGTGILLDRLRLRDLRPPGRDGDRRQLAEVPARRGRALPRRRARRVPAAALPQGRAAARVRRRGARRRRSPAPTRSSRRTRSTSTTSSTSTLAAWARVAEAGRHASGSTPATCATRAPPRTSGSSTRRSTWCTRWRPGSCAPTRAGPRTATCSTTASGCARTSTGATASSSRRARSTTTSTRSKAPGSTIEDVIERTIEASVEEWYEFLAAYADAVLGWVGGSAKVDGAPATRGGRRRPARPAPRVA